MSIEITDEATVRLARELATETGELLTEAIRRALEERRRHALPLAARVRRVQERLRQFPVVDARSVDELVGYDEQGVAG